LFLFSQTLTFHFVTVLVDKDRVSSITSLAKRAALTDRSRS